MANVGIGIALFESGGCNTFDADQYTILWVYIGFVAFLLLLQMILFVVFTIIAFGAEPESTCVDELLNLAHLQYI